MAVSKIAHSEHLRETLKEDVIDSEMRSEASLTMSLLGLISEEQKIKTTLGGKFGSINNSNSYNEIFCVTNNKNITMKELLLLFNRAQGNKTLIFFIPMIKKYENLYYLADRCNIVELWISRG